MPTPGNHRDHDGEDDAGGNDDGGWLPAPLSKALKLLVLALVVNFLVLPQLGGARRALELVGEVSIALLAVAALLQVGAYVTHAQLTRALIPRESRPGLGTMLRIELSSRAVSHVVPGGTAAGAALGFRLLQRSGVPGADAGFASAMQGIGAAIVLNVLLWLALVASIPLRGFHPLYATAALAGVALLGGFGVLVLLLTRSEQRATRILRAVVGRLPFLDPDAAGRALQRVAERVRDLLGDRRLMGTATGWATAHWLCDAASLWVFLGAFGHFIGLDALVVAFGIANVLAVIPITPRGLGVVEATLIAILVSFGVPRAETILGVVSYRLVSFWLPIPVGAASYLSLEVTLGAGRRPSRETLVEVAARTAEERQRLADWAAERGLRLRPGDEAGTTPS